MVLRMVLRMVFVHGFGHDGFRSKLLDDSTCIYMYFNIERNIMKSQCGTHNFGIQGEMSVYICFMCYAFTIFYFLFFEFVCSSFLYEVKTYMIFNTCFISTCGSFVFILVPCSFSIS